MCSCNMDCFNCIYDDCINDCKSESQYRYNHSEQGRQAKKRYAQSEKGKQAQARYAKSDKGKARDKRKMEKRIASGKNAEACRRYYLKKKAEKVLKS